MARARNIKPSFFLNEDIVELPYEARLLFIGLWTLADREGRLENRPKKIKMSLFPADDINVSEQLSNISKYGFIKLYNVDGLDVIQIENFVKHQTPHGLEKDSELPDNNGTYTVYFRNPKNKTVTGKPIYLKHAQLADFYAKTGEFSANQSRENSYQSSKCDNNKGLSTGSEQDNNSYETVFISDQNALNPESFNLNPDSLNPCLNTHTNTHEENSNAEVWNPDVEHLKAVLQTTKFSSRVSEILSMEEFKFHLGNFNVHHEKNFQLSDNQRHRKFAQWLIQEFEKQLQKLERESKPSTRKPSAVKQNRNVNDAWEEIPDHEPVSADYDPNEPPPGVSQQEWDEDWV